MGPNSILFFHYNEPPELTANDIAAIRRVLNQQQLKRKEKTMNRSEVIKKRLAELEMELAEVSRLEGSGIDKDGTVVRFDRKYIGRDITYTYVAIRCAGKWYLSGRYEDRALTDQQLMDKLLESETISASVVKGDSEAWKKLEV